MLCRVVRRSRLRAEASRALRASRGCAVSRPFSHRFAAAGRAGASMQMFCVVVLVHAEILQLSMRLQLCKICTPNTVAVAKALHWGGIGSYFDTVVATRYQNMIIES